MRLQEPVQQLGDESVSAGVVRADNPGLPRDDLAVAHDLRILRALARYHVSPVNSLAVECVCVDSWSVADVPNPWVAARHGAHPPVNSVGRVWTESVVG